MTFQYIYGIFVGLLIALLLPDGQLAAFKAAVRRWAQAADRFVRAPLSGTWRRASAATEAVTPTTAEAAQEATAGATARPVGPILADLQGQFERGIEDLPHSRDFLQNEAFEKAVAVLADVDVPLDTVVAYSIGTSWSLSCVGLAALTRRFDREEAREQILANFDRLVPFAVYFGLEYMQSLDPRPALGAPVVAARDWWPNNTLITILFKEYFARAEELGDEIEFGPTLAEA